jgi:hypothetical protein
VKNWRRLRGETRDEGDWGLAPCGYLFQLLGHFITQRGAIEELDRHAFDVDAIFSSDSARPRGIQEKVDATYMYFVARARP